MQPRKPRREATATAAGDAPPTGYARSRAKADAVRADLDPLGPGERPRAVVVATVVALVLAVAVVVGTFTSSDLAARGGSIAGGLTIGAAFVLVAAAMWRTKGWAVLAFQAFLAAEILFSSLALLRASSWWAVVLCVGVVGLSGWLFWKLVGALARIQMPPHPSS